MATKKVPGVVVRHREGCATRAGRTRCTCTPSYRAWVSVRNATGGYRKLQKTFKTEEAASLWRKDQRDPRRRVAADSPTLGHAADELIAGMRDGSIPTRSGDPYKPSAIRSYEQALKEYVLPALGRRTQLADVTPGHVQKLVEHIRKPRTVERVRDGRRVEEEWRPSPSTVRNALLPLRVIFNRATRLGQVLGNPVAGAQLPAVRGGRDRIVAPDAAIAMLAALSDATDRAIWSAAFFAGLRLGELRALHWEDIDFTEGLIRVRRSWDPKAGEVEPKSARGRRDVPMIARLRDVLTERRAACRWTHGLAFGIGSATPFNLTGLYGRSRREWAAAGLDVISPHDARHTYASFLIAAGADFKVIQEAMGHASITTTIDRYGHLLPGTHAVTAGKLDELLDRADSASRGSQLDGERAGNTRMAFGASKPARARHGGSYDEL